MKLIFKIFYLAQHIHSIIISTCNQYKNHESILNFFVLLKMCMYFTLIAHLLLDKPPFKCPGALCGQWLLATTLGSTALGLQARISQSLEKTLITNICWWLLCVWLCYQMCHINALNESLIQSLHPHTISSIIIPIIRKKKARFWAGSNWSKVTMASPGFWSGGYDSGAHVLSYCSSGKQVLLA